MDAIAVMEELQNELGQSEVTVDLIRIGLRCSVCNHTWGVRSDDLERLLIQKEKFICFRCKSKNPNT